VRINPIKFRFTLSASFLVVLCLQATILGQKHRVPSGGRLAIVVEERLSALRVAPTLSAKLIERLSRGRFVAIIGRTHSQDGLTFYRVKITRRRNGWIQSDAVISSAHAADDLRLMRLIRSAEDFELVARARIFLETFPASSLRPAVLLLYGDGAEGMSEKLSREAGRRLDQKEMAASGAPEFSYFLNYNALDRYNRQNVHFVFDRNAKQFHYDGATWREIVRRYPNSPEAAEARKRLERLAPFLKN
jgi:hypothetical protein